MKEFNLNFDGSILDENREHLPSHSGIYLVYRGTLNSERTRLHCKEIIYIGQSTDIRRCNKNHESRSRFLERLEDNEVLFYSYAPINSDDLKRVEAALVYKQKPLLNDQLKDNFLYPPTHIISSGACALLEKDFIVGS